MRVPQKCLGCGSEYQSGTAKAGTNATAGDKATYGCGATFRCREIDGEVRGIMRNCPKHDRKKR